MKNWIDSKGRLHWYSWNGTMRVTSAPENPCQVKGEEITWDELVEILNAE